MLGRSPLVTHALVASPGAVSAPDVDDTIRTGLPLKNILNPYERGVITDGKHPLHKPLPEPEKPSVKEYEDRKADLERQAKDVELRLQRERTSDLYQRILDEEQRDIEIAAAQARQDALLAQSKQLWKEIVELEQLIRQEQDDEEAFFIMMGLMQ